MRRQRHRLVHMVIQRPMATPDVVRWYVRYVWLGSDRVTRDRVVAQGDLDVEGREGSELIRACLLMAAEQLETP